MVGTVVSAIATHTNDDHQRLESFARWWYSPVFRGFTFSFTILYPTRGRELAADLPSR